MAGELTSVVTGGTIEASFTNNVKDRTVMRYASTAERTSLIPSPVQGDVAYMEDSDELCIYDGSAWNCYLWDYETGDDGYGVSWERQGDQVTIYMNLILSGSSNGSTPYNYPTGNGFVSALASSLRPATSIHFLSPVFGSAGGHQPDDQVIVRIATDGTITYSPSSGCTTGGSLGAGNDRFQCVVSYDRRI